MTRIVWVLIALFTAVQAYSQSVDKADDQGTNPSSAITIAVSKFDLEDGNSFYEEAEGLERKGDFNEALTLFGKAAFEYNAVRNFNKYGQAIMKMGNMHYLLGRFSDAEQLLLNVALKNYSKMGSKTGLMNAYQLLGKVYLANNKYTQSMWFYTQQGILAKQMKSNHAIIESILGIANVKIKKKDYKLALRDLQSAEWLASSIKSNAYKSQIKDARELIAVRSTSKAKG